LSISKVKNLTICALLLINVFFLSIILMDNFADARERRAAIESLCEILQLNGISLSPENIKTNDSLVTMRTNRDTNMEREIARLFLGQVDITEQGVIYHYDSANIGAAEFYSGGDFEIWVYEKVILSENNPLDTIENFLKSMEQENISYELTYEDSIETVKAIIKYEDVLIFNCNLEFIFRNNSLINIKGRLATGIEPLEQGEPIDSLANVLMVFLSAVRKGNIICTEITRVEAGYQHNVVGSFGDGVLAPVWLITTDNGQYIIESATGELRFA